MDLLSLILAVAIGAATGGADETRATIIDTGATSAATTTETTTETDETRATIIDTGANGQ